MESGYILIYIIYMQSGYIYMYAAAAAKSIQSCPTLCDPIDGSPPGSPVPGILQARTREWVAISFSNAGKWKVKVNSLSHVWLLATPWTGAYQAPPSMGFSRQECWSGVPSPSPCWMLILIANNKETTIYTHIYMVCFRCQARKQCLSILIFSRLVEYFTYNCPHSMLVNFWGQ